MGDEEFNKLFNEIFGRDFTRAELGLTERTGNIELERQGKRVRDSLRTSLDNDPEARQGIKDYLEPNEEDRAAVDKYNHRINDWNYMNKPKNHIVSEKTLAQYDAEVAGLPAALRKSLTGQAVDAGITALPTQTRRSVSSSRSKSSVTSALLRS